MTVIMLEGTDRRTKVDTTRTAKRVITIGTGSTAQQGKLMRDPSSQDSHEHHNSPSSDQETSEALSDVRYLLGEYRKILQDVDRESAISIMGFIRLYAKYTWLLLNLGLLPLVLVLNFAIWIWNKSTHSNKRYIPYIFWQYGRDAVRALYRGDIPALKFVTLRYATELFAALHIRNRLRKIKIALVDKELDWMLSGDNHTQVSVETKETKKMLNKLDNTLFERVVPTALLLLVPYVPGTLKLLFEQKAVIEYFKQLAHPEKRSIELLLYVAILSVYTLVVIVSSFVLKREIFKKREIFRLEYRVFTKLRWPFPNEFPLDLAGYSFLGLVMPLLQLFVLKRLSGRPQAVVNTTDTLNLIVTVSVFICLPLAYAAWRRRKDAEII